MGSEEEGPVRLNEAGRLVCLALGPWTSLGSNESPFEGAIPGQGIWGSPANPAPRLHSRDPIILGC